MIFLDSSVVIDLIVSEGKLERITKIKSHIRGKERWISQVQIAELCHWSMKKGIPIGLWYEHLIDTVRVADLTNSDGSGEAGCITAGAFLSHFAGDTPFAHCDISPACWKSGPHALGPSGATGAMVTTLVDAFRSYK